MAHRASTADKPPVSSPHLRPLRLGALRHAAQRRRHSVFCAAYCITTGHRKKQLGPKILPGAKNDARCAGERVASVLPRGLFFSQGPRRFLVPHRRALSQIQCAPSARVATQSHLVQRPLPYAPVLTAAEQEAAVRTKGRLPNRRGALGVPAPLYLASLLSSLFGVARQGLLALVPRSRSNGPGTRKPGTRERNGTNRS